MSLKHEREAIKAGEGVSNLVANSNVMVPFAVMAWDGDDTEWYPIFVCTQLAVAIEYVKEILAADPNEAWDIQENVKIKVSEFLK